MPKHPRPAFTSEATPRVSRNPPLDITPSSLRNAPQGSHTHPSGTRGKILARERSHNFAGPFPKRPLQTQLSHYFPKSLEDHGAAGTPHRLSRSDGRHHASPFMEITNLATPIGTREKVPETFRTSDGLILGSSSKSRRLSPADSMLGRTPRSTLKGSVVDERTPQSSAACLDSADDSEEEAAWLRRAQMLSRRRQNEEGLTISSQGEIEPTQRESVRANFAPIISPQKSGHSGAVKTPVTPDPVMSPVRPAPCREASSPFQETPWLHDSLSELSMLPWERDAALKLPQYRNSTGSKVTERDLQVKREMQRAMAQTAQREAIARSIAQGSGKAAEGRQTNKAAYSMSNVNHQSPSGTSAERSPVKKPIHPTGVPRELSDRHQLAPPPRPPPNGNNTVSDVECRGVVKPDSTVEAEDVIHRPGSARSAALRGRPKDSLPVTPGPILPAIRSPRSKRKVYAIETQDGAPLPSPAEFRAVGVMRSTNGQASGTPTSSTLQRHRVPQKEIGIVSPDHVSKRPASEEESGEPSTAHNLRDHLILTSKLSPRSRESKQALQQSAGNVFSDQEEAGCGYTADSSSPSSSQQETMLIGGEYDEEPDDTFLPSSFKERPRTPVRGSEQAFKQDEDEEMEETQPLPFTENDNLSEEEEEEEEDLLASRGSKKHRGNEHGLPDSPKPSRWTSINQAWEGISLDGLKRNQLRKSHAPQGKLSHFGFEGPSVEKRSGATRQKPSLPPQQHQAFNHPLSRDVTDHLSDDEGSDAVDGDDSGFVDGTRESDTVKHNGDRGVHQSRRIPYGADNSILKRSREVSPDSQATQQLAWDSVNEGCEEEEGLGRGRSRSETQDTSHTEDEAELPAEVLKIMRPKLTRWPEMEETYDRSGPSLLERQGTAQRKTMKHGQGSSLVSPLSLSSGDRSDSGTSDWVPEVPRDVESFFMRLDRRKCR